MYPWRLIQNQMWNRMNELKEYLLLDDIGDIFLFNMADSVTVYSGNLLDFI